MVDRPSVVIRAVGSSSIGLGHVVRSCTLARAMADEGADVELIGAGIPHEIVQRLGDELEVTPTSSDADVHGATEIVERHPDLVVVDGYEFTAAFFGVLDDARVPYAVLDDNGETRSSAPFAVLNQNPHAVASMYSHLSRNVRLLLGLDYVLIRPEIVAAAELRRERSDGIFVSIGGSDPRQLTYPIAARLADIHRAVRVAVGPAVSDRDDLVERIGQLHGVDVIVDDQYPEELATCEVAVLAAGTSLWEAACVGTPVVAVVVADNQRDSASAAADGGIVRAVVDATEYPDTADQVALIVRRHLSAGTADHPPVLGSGARRAARCILDAAPAANGSDPRGRRSRTGTTMVELRPAMREDSGFLLELRNDRDVVRASRTDREVSSDEHREWLNRSLTRPDRRIFVVASHGLRIGQARLDMTSEGEIVSIALDARHRGRGFGRQVLIALQQLASRPLLAEVRIENEPSLALFKNVGFVPIDVEDGFMHLRWTPDGQQGGSS